MILLLGKIIRWSVIILALLTWATAGYSQTIPNPFPANAVTTLPPLPNGLRVVVSENHEYPVVAMQVVVHGGAATQDNACGVAHLLEHVSFLGTVHYPDFFAPQIALENAGGVSNAVTTRDAIRFTATIPSSNVDLLCKVLADITLYPQISEKYCTIERPIIHAEIERDYDNPTTELIDLAYAQAFRVHPYKYPALGNRDTLQQITVSTVQTFHDRWCSPQNMTVILVGDITPTHARQLALDTFGGAKSISLEDTPVPEPCNDGAHIVTQHYARNIAATYQAMVFPMPAGDHLQTISAIDLFSTMLADGSGALLPSAWANDGVVVEQFGIEAVPMRAPGCMIIWAKTSPEMATKLHQSTLRLLTSLSEYNNLQPSMLETAMKRIQTQYLLENQTYTQQADTLAYYANLGNAGFASSYLPTLQSINLSQVRAIIPSHCLAWITMGQQPKGL